MRSEQPSRVDDAVGVSSNGLTIDDRAREDPVELYLAGLNSPRSRETMRACLNSVARLAGARDARNLDWTSLDYPALQILRACMGEQYPPNTANTMMAGVRGVLHACWQLGRIESETYLRAREIKPFRGRRLPAGRMLSQAEQTALFGACAADPGVAGARDAAALALMLGGGLRKAETASLTWPEAVDLDAGYLRIIGKGDKERLVPLPPESLTAIRAWLAVRGDTPGALFVQCRRKAAFVWKERLVPLAPDGKALGDILARRCKQAGIERCTPHDLRRTYVSVLLDAGVDLFTVQQLAGHANPATTARYDRRGDARLKAAAHRMRVPYVGRN